MRRHGSTLASAGFVLAVLGVANVVQSLPLAIYALSFWHYYHYWLAYRFGAIPLQVFKRDAVLMKTVALGALAVAYLSAPPDLPSLAVIGFGFLLNMAAASALGSDRTYYGHEVAGLPPERVTAFPYSLIAHPMLIGNIAAFGGTLLNPAFRHDWWPLACAHVLLNLGLLLMETNVAPGQGRARWNNVWLGGGAAVAGAALGAAAGWPGAALGAVIFLYSHLLYGFYSSPTR